MFCNKVLIRSPGNRGGLVLEFPGKTRLGVEHDAVDTCFPRIVLDVPDVRARCHVYKINICILILQREIVRVRALGGGAAVLCCRPEHSEGVGPSRA